VKAFQREAEPSGQQVDTAMVAELRERMPIDEQVEPIAPNSMQSLGNRNVKRTDLEEALRELPSNERLVFLLRDVESYSPDQVAELLELNRSQVERTLLSARIRLRSVLANQAQPRSQAA
jgi:RNA polymerase sigma-70 factor (ECF subfamily)